MTLLTLDHTTFAPATHQGPAVDDTRSIEDFDLAALCEGLDLAAPSRAAAAVESEKAAYEAAALRDGSRAKRAASEFYHEANAALFRRRMDIERSLRKLESCPDLGTRQAKSSRRRLERHLDSITAVIVHLNYGMTRNYVRKFLSTTSQSDTDDFQGAALVGLMNAVDSFDPSRGKFSSWAYKRIQREVLRAVRDADFVNMNHGDFEKRPAVLRARSELTEGNGGHAPTVDEIAAHANCTVALAKRVLEAPRLESMYTPMTDDGTTELKDVIPDPARDVDDTVTSALDVTALLEYGMPVLDPRERYVLVRRFGLDDEPAQRLSGIGRQLRLSREAVRQIENKALAKILHPRVLRSIVRHGR